MRKTVCCITGVLVLSVCGGIAGGYASAFHSRDVGVKNQTDRDRITAEDIAAIIGMWWQVIPPKNCKSYALKLRTPAGDKFICGSSDWKPEPLKIFLIPGSWTSKKIGAEYTCAILGGKRTVCRTAPYRVIFYFGNNGDRF